MIALETMGARAWSDMACALALALGAMALVGVVHRWRRWRAAWLMPARVRA